MLEQEQPQQQEKRPELERLTEEGWEFVSSFAEKCKIYQREDERLLYDSKIDEIVLQYIIPPDEIEKTIRQQEKCTDCYKQSVPYTPGCHLYQSFLISEVIQLGERCVTLQVIDEDFEKKERGETHLTFPDIADKILKDKNTSLSLSSQHH